MDHVLGIHVAVSLVHYHILKINYIIINLNYVSFSFTKDPYPVHNKKNKQSCKKEKKNRLYSNSNSLIFFSIEHRKSVVSMFFRVVNISLEMYDEEMVELYMRLKNYIFDQDKSNEE